MSKLQILYNNLQNHIKMLWEVFSHQVNHMFEIAFGFQLEHLRLQIVLLTNLREVLKLLYLSMWLINRNCVVQLFRRISTTSNM